MTDQEKIDFVLQILIKSKEYQEVGVLRFDDFDLQTGFEADCESLEGKIVECKLDGSHWMYMRFRDDKDEPNHISTYEKVLKSIEDNITSEVLLSLTETIKSNWKTMS
eukprot:NODE_255_length_11697_cov_0.569495.p9 type:complete len:108 gc:universal NODE_255_length_11697_cov_0.569495:1188-1511(+)